MRSHLAIGISFTLITILVGCSTPDASRLEKELEQMRENLGDFQYQGVDPQLSVSISDVEWTFDKGSIVALDSYYVNYQIAFKQNNKTFPLSKYSVSCKLSVKSPKGKTVETVFVSGMIENGVLTFREEGQRLFLPEDSTDDFYDYVLEAESYNWYPESDFKVYTRLEDL